MSRELRAFEDALIVQSIVARSITASRLTLGPARQDAKATESLKKMKLQGRNKGDLQSAVLSAGFHAQKSKKTMYVYSGNSFGHLVWRVTEKPGDYLSPINNTGEKLLYVTPELEVFWQDIKRPKPSEESEEA